MGQGQSGQAIELFQITSYIIDFQTLNNTGSWQPVGASKNYFYRPLLTVFPTLSSLMTRNLRSYPTTVLNESM